MGMKELYTANYKTLKENCETMREEIIGVSEYCDIMIEKYNNLIKKR